MKKGQRQLGIRTEANGTKWIQKEINGLEWIQTDTNGIGGIVNQLYINCLHLQKRDID